MTKGHGSTIRVLTFNIGNGRADSFALIPMLRSADCDLVALQEVSEAQGSALDRELSDSYPHRVILPNGVPGKAVLSRHPISEHEEMLLECGRPHLCARIEYPGKALQIIVAHVPLEHTLFSLVGPAGGEIDALASRSIRSPLTLLVGDFNKTPLSFLYRRLRRHGLVDAFQHVGKGPGFTFPVFGRFHRLPLPPLVRIDYVWHTPDVRAIACRTGLDGGSDHLAVLAELAL